MVVRGTLNDSDPSFLTTGWRPPFIIVLELVVLFSLLSGVCCTRLLNIMLLKPVAAIMLMPSWLAIALGS